MHGLMQPCQPTLYRKDDTNRYIYTFITYLTLNSDTFTLKTNTGFQMLGIKKWCVKYGFSTSERAVLAHDRFHAPVLTAVHKQFTFRSQSHKEIK